MKDSVLIIDDEIDICFLVSHMLRKKQLPVSFANSLEEGMQKLDSLLPSIVFLDINLPDGSGLDQVRIIKARFPHIKIVMISAYDGNNERTKAKHEGADHFIGKPLNKELIYAALDTLMVRAVSR